jgi:hypothetical protein
MLNLSVRIALQQIEKFHSASLQRFQDITFGHEQLYVLNLVENQGILVLLARSSIFKDR